ncbi:MAG: hypothetical protein KA354_17630 [Phycisphaerae bacterium]|nr:hypothetical protein [Phycisphaerae bacterium]
MPQSQVPELQPDTRKLASHIAMVIRNAMEDFHHEHLTDAQMKQLNPIIRNVVCTALHAFENCEHSRHAREFMDFNFMLIPKYWEKPELLRDYLRLWEASPGVS